MQGQGRQYVTRGPAAFNVELDTQTNVYLMDQSNWNNVNAGRSARAVDSVHATRRQVVVHAPHAGTWWVVIEATGRPIRFSITASDLS
jgi:hypothetical protein